MKIQKVLVAVDFSPGSHAAIARAGELAGDKAELVLFHAVPHAIDYGSPSTGEKLTKEMRDRAANQLGDLAQDLRNERRAKVGTEVAIGRAADEILAAAERDKVDLIAIGAHGKSVAGRFFLGTVSEEVARRSPIPVLVVREQAEGKKLERVLIALDHDAPSREAAKAAVEVAGDAGIPAEGIHVIDLPLFAPYGPGPVGDRLGDLTPELVAEVRCAIQEETKKALGGKTVPIRFLAGPAAREIARCARPTDLIVCSTHGRSALGRFAFGSVATKLLRKAPCPVLVVRPAEKPAAKAKSPAKSAGARK